MPEQRTYSDSERMAWMAEQAPFCRVIIEYSFVTKMYQVDWNYGQAVFRKTLGKAIDAAMAKEQGGG